MRRPVTESERVDGPYPYYGANGQQGTIDGYIFDEPLVLLAEDGGHFNDPSKGIAYRISGKTWVNNHAHVLRPKPEIDLGFLCRVLENYDVTPWVTGTTRGKLTQAGAAQIVIPVPPLPEQRRIAEILDKADALRAKRRATLRKLDELTQYIFLDMFGDPATNPKGWPERMLGEVFEICSSRRVLESQWKKEGVPFYRAREIVKLAKDGYVDNDLFISEDLFNELSAGNGAPKAGDLMVSAVGTLGACYQVREGDRFYFKDASVLRFIPKGEVEPAFVRYAFSTDYVLGQVHSGSGSTVGTYTIARARQTRLYLPPIELQRRFAHLVERVQRHAKLHSAAMRHFDSLFAALQRRAFSGGL